MSWFLLVNAKTKRKASIGGFNTQHQHENGNAFVPGLHSQGRHCRLERSRPRLSPPYSNCDQSKQVDDSVHGHAVAQKDQSIHVICVVVASGKLGRDVSGLCDRGLNVVSGRARGADTVC